jgi:hypothetical protein
VLYGVAAERELTEQELPWLPGYRNRRRAHRQRRRLRSCSSTSMES